MYQVRELGNPKGSKKPKDLPNHHEICESCKTYLDTDDEIPLPLLAKLIKFKLLDIKEKDKKRRESEKKVLKSVVYIVMHSTILGLSYCLSRNMILGIFICVFCDSVGLCNINVAWQ